jgi:outer membrane protein OmpA-like peptidoglycan-associated protein
MRNFKSIFITSLLICSLVTTSVSAQELLPRDSDLFGYHPAPDYRTSESHPLRLVAYVLNPIGWALDEGIFRPISSFASSTKLTRAVMGYRDPYDFRETECFKSGSYIPNCSEYSPLIGIEGYGRKSNNQGISEEIVTSDDESMAADFESSEQLFIPDVSFDYNKDTLTPLGRGRVRQAAQILSDSPTLSVVVEGNTDSRGNEEYNKLLAEKRAQTVVNELTELGIDPARLTISSRGEENPIFTGSEDWAYAVNRRVAFQAK